MWNKPPEIGGLFLRYRKDIKMKNKEVCNEKR